MTQQFKREAKRDAAQVTRSYQRTFPLTRSGGDYDDGELEFSLSSETPVERYYGIEILSHDRDAIDLSRLNDGRHPLLLNHSSHDQIGVIERAWIDDDRKMLRVRARFSRSDRAQEIKQDVEDDIRTLVSVGYFIEQVVEERTGADGQVVSRTLSGEQFEREIGEQQSKEFRRSLRKGGRKGDKLSVYTVTRWTPFEGSIVAVPADPKVGKGRSEEKVMSDIEVIDDDGGHRSRSQRRALGRASESRQEVEAERTRTIVALGKGYSKYLTQKDVADAVEEGWSVDRVRELITDRQQTRHIDTRDTEFRSLGNGEFERVGGWGYGADVVDGAAREWAHMSKRYSITRLIAAMADPAGFMSGAGLELEVSREESRRSGLKPQGMLVPYEILGGGRRDFTMTGTAGGANLLAVSVFGPAVEALRPMSALIQAGVRVLTGLTGDVMLPRVGSGATAGMLTEQGTAAESDVAMASVVLKPHRLSTYVEASKQSIIQASESVETLLRDDLLRAGGSLIDSQGINGAGTGAEMRGLRNTPGIGTAVAGANGANLAWLHLIELEAQCANANAISAANAAYIFNSKTIAKAKTTQKGTNLSFILDSQEKENRVNGARWFTGNNLPSNLTKGTSTTVCSSALFGSDWDMAVLGLFGAADITVDPYTKAKEGTIVITLNQFADFGVRQPAAFSKIEDLLTS